jgi:mannose-1-phosphate guanylyltransferase
MNIPVVAVVMAGGSGERFWPISRRLKPKQLLYLTREDKNLLHEAVERLFPIIPPEDCFIATNAHLQEPIRASLDILPAKNIIAEPIRRNTTGCLLYSAAHALAHHQGQAGDAVMAVITADHRIDNIALYTQTIQAAIETARHNEALVIIGIKPTRPETGYGYIEINSATQPQVCCDIPIHPVAFFREKPNQEVAEEYLKQESFFWNSGMFFWKISTFANTLKKYHPRVHALFTQLCDLVRENKPGDGPEIHALFQQIPNMSIDYILMEKADNVFMAPGHFVWDDLGSWDCLSRFRPKDQNNNVAIGDPILIDCHNATVYNECGEEIALGVIGLDNIVVVATKDGLLVCPKERSQEVRKIVEQLKNKNAKQI